MKRLLEKIVRNIKFRILLFFRLTLLEGYTRKGPDIQQTFDIFKGQWASKIPIDNLQTGDNSLFDDERINWYIKNCNGFSGKTVLELGPLEGGHTYMVSKDGASKITSIEANSRAYLKCLLVKEHVKIENTEFLFGEFNDFLRQTTQTYDIILAIGVLYHMTDPVDTLLNICAHTDTVFLWTHYYDAQTMSADDVKAFKKTVSQKITEEYSCTLHKRNYGSALSLSHFCGGTERFAMWMEKQDIFKVFESRGFNHHKIQFDRPDTKFGPSIAVVFSKNRI